jgi:non-specific serine/threonine protein kinase
VIGRTIGSYQIVARIGAGGMGEVYAARDANLDRPVALKLLPADAAADPERLRRFHTEARAASSLNHPHILVVHDFGEVDGRPFIVTELVDGRTIRDMLRTHAFGVEEAVAIVSQVALALEAAHARGVVHRDVKPENVMLRPDGFVKVLDFGLAKLVEARPADAETAMHTTAGAVLGTPRYMSPEQARGLDVDLRSDIWSVGVMLYEMIAGRPPFTGATAADLVSAILLADPAPLATAASGDLAVVNRIVTRALRKKPEDRYPDMRGVIADLTAVQRRVEILTGSASPDAPPATPNNLPAQLTPFIGRDDEINGVRTAIAGARLVTMIGAGGVGKTRLALRVGVECLAAFPHGVWLVDLAPVSDGALVAAAVADAVGAPHRPARPIIESLRGHLRDRSLLLIVDNCEHVIDACADLVHQILAGCSGVKIIATSREALAVSGEVAWRVRSLGVPDAGPAGAAALMRIESVQLFAQRGRAARPGFEVTAENGTAVSQICRRLDGLPLAIELAAARLRAMSPAEIATRLDDRFRLLTGGARAALPRQRTLEATVSWSYELLSDAERALFDRLSVFAGGWTLEAAERICQFDRTQSDADISDLIARLVDRSLVVADETMAGTTRYRLLETLRQFGRDRLVDRGEATCIRNQHLSWAVALAERIPPQTTDRRPPDVAAEMDNLRTALEWAGETGAHDAGLRLISSASWILSLTERRRILKQLLPFAGAAPLEVQSRVLFVAGSLAFMMGDWHWGVEALDAGAEISARAGDSKRVSMSLAYAASCYSALGDRDTALVKIERAVAVARESGNTEALARSLALQAWLEIERDLAQAETVAIAGEAMAQGYDSTFDLAHFREVRGFIRCLKGDFASGADVLADAMPLFEQIQENCGAHILETAAAWSAMTGRFAVGAELLGASGRIREETGDQPRPWERIVQDVWLPKIAAALAPDDFAAARARGAQRAFRDALDFARRELRAAVSAL